MLANEGLEKQELGPPGTDNLMSPPEDTKVTFPVAYSGHRTWDF